MKLAIVHDNGDLEIVVEDIEDYNLNDDLGADIVLGCIQRTINRIKAFQAASPESESEERNMCKSCEVVHINGVLCHEIGCPDAWKDYTRTCLWCGREFKPHQSPRQTCCSGGCAKAYGHD